MFLHELGYVSSIPLLTATDCQQFEIAVIWKTDDAIRKASGKVATLADFEPQPFIIVLGLSEVANSDPDVIDAPPLPEKGLDRRLTIVRLRARRRRRLRSYMQGREN